MPDSPLLSVVAPVYNEEPVLPEFHARLSGVLRPLGVRYEILYVDDGSVDRTAALLEELSRKDGSVRALLLTRNFGHQTALSAGLDFASGEAVVTMDADLQHPPELIPRLLEHWRSGAKVVHAVREDTEGVGLPKKWSSALYYRVVNALSSTPIAANAADFRLLDRQAVEALKSMKERNRFLRGMIGWLGMPEASVPFSAPRRAAGGSKYTWRKMLRMGVDGILSFSVKPLRAALWLGLFVLAVNVAYAAFILYNYFFRHATIKGWASLILFTMFMNSIQLILLGVIGEYIGRMYEESKARPLYLVRRHLP